MKRKVEIHRSDDKQFYYNLVGDNGKVLATSETVKRKSNLLKVVKKYFRTFAIDDLTRFPNDITI